jgi:hypothetical protein
MTPRAVTTPGVRDRNGKEVAIAPAADCPRSGHLSRIRKGRFICERCGAEHLWLPNGSTWVPRRRRART